MGWNAYSMVILITHKSTRAFKIYRPYTFYLRHSTWILRTNKCVFLPHSMELLVSHLVKKLPTFYGIWNFITVFTTTAHMSLFLSHINRVHAFQSYFLKTYFNNAHLWFGALSVLFLTDFTTLNLCALQACTFVSVNYIQKHLTI